MIPDVLMPNKVQDTSAVLDRLRRRIGSYRKRHDDASPIYENTVTCQNNQQRQETFLLKQKYIETPRTKKSAKKAEKKQHSENSGASCGPNKSNKRQNEDDQNAGEGYEPPSKIGGAARGTSSPLPSNSTNSSLYKQGFSQNGKRGVNKNKNLDSQKYQASSSNHPKNGIGIGAPPSQIPPNSSNFSQCNASQSSAHVTEFKKESNASSVADFADLEQCAAALEKDAAKNGENATEDFLNSDMLNDLISEISDINPELMIYLNDGPPPTGDDLNDVTLHSGTPGNSNTESFHPGNPITPITPATASPMRPNTHGHHSGVKMESGGGGTDGTTIGVHGTERGLSHCAGPSPAPASTASPLASQLGSSSSHQPSPSQSYSGSHFVLDNGQTGSPLNNSGLVNSGNAMPKPSTRLPYSSPAGLVVDSPAAQALKHMAEQNQLKNQAQQMCMSNASNSNGGVSFKNQGSVGSPAGSPYGAMNNYNGNMSEFPGSSNNMNPGSNCQVKQEVCSPGNPQAGFSPSSMMVDKRTGQHNGNSPSGQSSRIPNMNSAGGSPIMSPISKSFNHPNSSQAQISQQQQQQSQPPNYMPHRMPGPPPQAYQNTNPRFPSAPNAPAISVASPKSTAPNQGHVNDRGSPAKQIDSKPQLRMNAPNPQMMQQFSSQQQQQQFPYGNGQNPNMPVEMGFNSGNHPPNAQMQAQSQHQQQASGQTINFTQQHLRMGNGPGIPNPRLPMPPMNRMGMPQRLPGGMEDMPPQPQQRPHLEPNHPQRMIRPPRHNMLPPHQQMQMGGVPQQQQMSNVPGPGMGVQMVNRFPGMPNNPQMMPQQGYPMGGNMQMGGPGGPSNNSMPMRRPPYGPGPGFQGMNPRNPGEQMLSNGPQNPHPQMGNPGVPHNEWMSNMNNMPDVPCPPYSGPQQRHPAPQPEMRPSLPPQQYHSGVPQNQGAPVQRPSSMTNNFVQQQHDHMMGQQTANFDMSVQAQNHSQQQQLHHHQQQQQQQSSQPQLPPNFSQHPGGPNNLKMSMSSHHPQQPPPQPPMYGNSNNGFPPHMKPNGNNMCGPQGPMSHHPQMQQQPPHQPPPPQHMYNMGNNNMINSVGAQGQMNNHNANMNMSDQQEFNLDLLGGGDQFDTSINEDLLSTLDSVFP